MRVDVRPSIASAPPTIQGPLRAGVTLCAAVTLLNSMATGLAYNGLYFLTDTIHRFSVRENLGLALLMGVTYIAGALLVGPGMRAVLRAGVSPRRVLLGLMILLALAYALPVGAWAIQGEGSRWSVWCFAGSYSALCGCLWPIVESYVSGARAGRELRSATGVFNITWSSALVGSMLIVSWLPGLAGVLVPALSLSDRRTGVLVVGGALHLLSMVLIVRLPARPGVHGDSHDHAVPASYPRLLAVHRALLPTSYAVMYLLLPMLPSILHTLLTGVGLSADHAAAAAPTIAAVWLSARIGTFALMNTLHAWHGRWHTATLGTAGMFAGFLACVLAPTSGALLGPWGALGVGVLGLGLFGTGVAGVYFAALYYALEVGSDGVDAGGAHEALIGVGYTAGPVLGLLAVHLGPAGRGWVANEAWATLGLAGGGVMLGVGLAVMAGAYVRNRPG